MYRRGITALGAACAVALAISACSDGSSSAGSGSGDSSAIKVGILTSLGGSASAGFSGTVSGVNARFAAYTADGGKCADKTFDFIKGDDASSAQGALTATQKMIQQDKVDTVLDVSAFFFGAAQFATTTGKSTPIIGGAFDGAKQWENSANNLIPAGIVPNYSTTYSTTGDYFKSVGGTIVAGIAYESPASQAGLEAGLKSAEAVGLKRGYINTSVAFGSTDVGAIVLGIIRSKADVVDLTINPDTSFAIVAGLNQAGYKPKAILSATGYGADLLDSAPAVAAGQGVSFSLGWAPSEVKTAGTDRMTAAFKQYAGSKSGIPGFSQAMGWITADLYLHGLELTGCNPDGPKLISTLRPDKTWTANGLYPAPRDFTTIKAPKQCLYFVRLKGNDFVPEPKASPLCGTVVSS